jgi:hypothetical protein
MNGSHPPVLGSHVHNLDNHANMDYKLSVLNKFVMNFTVSYINTLAVYNEIDVSQMKMKAFAQAFPERIKEHYLSGNTVMKKRALSFQ